MLQHRLWLHLGDVGAVSNPISGEVGAAAMMFLRRFPRVRSFQTPSAGRWVLQPVKKDVDAFVCDA